MNTDWEIIEYKKLEKTIETVLDLNNKILNELTDIKKIVTIQEEKINSLLEENTNLSNKIDDIKNNNHKNFDLDLNLDLDLDSDSDINKYNLEITENNNNLNDIKFLNNDYDHIHRMTNRLWRTTPYTTTPKFFSNFLNYK